MLNESELSQLRRFARDAMQHGWLNKKGATRFMEVIDHYEQTIRPEPVQEHKAGNKRTRADSK